MQIVATCGRLTLYYDGKRYMIKRAGDCGYIMVTKFLDNAMLRMRYGC